MRLMVVAACTLALAPLLISTSALSEGKDASYYCTTQYAVGLAFDVQKKQWQNTLFTPDRAFVLNLHYLGDKRDRVFDQPVSRYSVIITARGSSKTERCVGKDQVGTDNAAPGEVDVYFKENIECETSFGLYRFNLVNNRFINFYPYGFIEGRDDGKDTPSINAGTCTLIQ